ncbi:MAG: hypothetical protein J1E60_08495 [Christensenellaceae bacterium]|nr:hypothetical protein [Christensenellaceae bacterium]
MRYAFIIIISIICVALVLFGAESMQGAANGFELFISNVFPSLFPFFVCVSALRYANAFAVGGGGFAGTVLRIFSISCISGSPSGTMLTDTAFGGAVPALDERKRSELCAITNLASPVFIVGTVCSKMLGEARLAPLIAVCHYGTALMLVLMFILKNRQTAVDFSRLSSSSPAYTPLTSILPYAIRDAVSTILQIGGTLVFFMVIIGIFDAIGAANAFSPCLKGSLFGVLEMTNGIGIIAHAQANPQLKCTLICAVLSLGGICVYLQANGVAKVRPMEYFKIKLIHAAAAGALCYLLYPHFTVNLAPVISVLGDRLTIVRIVTMGEIALCGALASIIAALLAIFASKRTRA